MDICYLVYTRDPIDGRILFTTNVYTTLSLAEGEVGCHCPQVAEYDEKTGMSVSTGASGELWVIEKHYLIKR